MTCRFGLLALPLLLLTADDVERAAHLDPSIERVQIGGRGAPETGEFVTTVYYPFSACTNDGSPVDGGADPTGEVNWRIEEAIPCIRIRVTRDGQPVTRGTVTLQYCDGKGVSTGLPLGDVACNGKGGSGLWATGGRMSLSEANGGVVTLGGPFRLHGTLVQGFRWRYAAQGSGIGNYSSASFNVGPGVGR